MTDSVGAWLSRAAEALGAAGIGHGRSEARLILSHVTGLDAAAAIGDPDRPLSDAHLAAMDAALARRAAREPMSHILGRREFWSLDFRVTPDVLDPRPDSETLVEAALSYLSDPDAAYRLLDLGTGTGCLMLSVLSERANATGVGIDASPAAADMARENAGRLGLDDRCEILVGEWTAPLDNDATFDAVLCNPPYVPSGEIDGLEPEVARHEPRGALDGGPDGLGEYRRLAGEIATVLRPGGRAFVEIGSGQAADVRQIFGDAGFAVPEVRKDLAGIPRCVVAKAPQR